MDMPDAPGCVRDLEKITVFEKMLKAKSSAGVPVSINGGSKFAPLFSPPHDEDRPRRGDDEITSGKGSARAVTATYPGLRLSFNGFASVLDLVAMLNPAGSCAQLRSPGTNAGAVERAIKSFPGHPELRLSHCCCVLIIPALNAKAIRRSPIRGQGENLKRV
ncbi:hypothetical protein K458DRAFT_489778 [Lentithecium fluviatile CBS 122367]|uniref:Uncharacterized protein n=1 Tax=Lentithecium fluviatile CBS 122367 TaxID=1168545 RepID=A0A6G1IRZ0_9PLEO|nr:hypothetical protein K458DRAFT_489778 [Lentithecium fluviatile CBS 122367]